jgi:dipeptide/tripeptide permease
VPAVSSAAAPPGSRPTVTQLSPDDRKWLHDKYERLAAEEGALALGRTSYYAAVGSVLVTGVVVALADLASERVILAAVATFLAALGILISFVWAVLLHRTNDAQAMWREAAERLEQDEPPLEGELPGAITLRSKEALTLNLLRPYTAHAARFSGAHAVSWMDRLTPERLTEILPIAFLVIWVSVLTFSWYWYLH